MEMKLKSFWTEERFIEDLGWQALKLKFISVVSVRF